MSKPTLTVADAIKALRQAQKDAYGSHGRAYVDKECLALVLDAAEASANGISVAEHQQLKLDVEHRELELARQTIQSLNEEDANKALIERQRAELRLLRAALAALTMDHEPSAHAAHGYIGGAR